MRGPAYGALFLLVILAPMIAGGCSRGEAVAPDSPMSTAPGGYQTIQDAATLKPHTTLYDSNGKIFGVVLAHDPNFTLPTGKTDKATEVCLVEGKPGF